MFSCFHGSSVFSRFGHGFWSRFEVVWSSFWDLVVKNPIKKVPGKLLLFRKAKKREKGHAAKLVHASGGFVAPNRRIRHRAVGRFGVSDGKVPIKWRILSFY